MSTRKRLFILSFLLIIISSYLIFSEISGDNPAGFIKHEEGNIYYTMGSLDWNGLFAATIVDYSFVTSDGKKLSSEEAKVNIYILKESRRYIGADLSEEPIDLGSKGYTSLQGYTISNGNNTILFEADMRDKTFELEEMVLYYRNLFITRSDSIPISVGVDSE
ncbi:MAG: hypothetical protein SCK28_12475 [Bacillota bacterium]|nr:hypothetical protein [Bacillota bacterium]